MQNDDEEKKKLYEFPFVYYFCLHCAPPSLNDFKTSFLIIMKRALSTAPHHFPLFSNELTVVLTVVYYMK
jgi:hypothetical protein